MSRELVPLQDTSRCYIHLTLLQRQFYSWVRTLGKLGVEPAVVNEADGHISYPDPQTEEHLELLRSQLRSPCCMAYGRSWGIRK